MKNWNLSLKITLQQRIKIVKHLMREKPTDSNHTVWFLHAPFILRSTETSLQFLLGRVFSWSCIMCACLERYGYYWWDFLTREVLVYDSYVNTSIVGSFLTSAVYLRRYVSLYPKIQPFKLLKNTRIKLLHPMHLYLGRKGFVSARIAWLLLWDFHTHDMLVCTSWMNTRNELVLVCRFILRTVSLFPNCKVSSSKNFYNHSRSWNWKVDPV